MRIINKIDYKEWIIKKIWMIGYNYWITMNEYD